MRASHGAKELSFAVKELSFAVEELAFAVEELAFAVKELTFAVEKLTFDVEELSFAVKKLTFAVEELTFAVEELTFAVEELTFAVKKLTFAVEELTFAVEELTFAVEELTFAVEELTFAVLLWATVPFSMVRQMKTGTLLSNGNFYFISFEDHYLYLLLVSLIAAPNVRHAQTYWKYRNVTLPSHTLLLQSMIDENLCLRYVQLNLIFNYRDCLLACFIAICL